MRAGSFKDQVIAVKAVYKQPVRFDMAVTVFLRVTGQLVVTVFSRKWFSLGKQIDYRAQFINIFVLFFGALVVLLELSRPDNTQASSSSKS